MDNTKYFMMNLWQINYYRFVVSSDASDQSIIYAISSEKYALKGILINAYGIYSEPITNEMLDKLKMPQEQ